LWPWKVNAKRDLAVGAVPVGVIALHAVPLKPHRSFRSVPLAAVRPPNISTREALLSQAMPWE